MNRGIRNNNPLNNRRSADCWQGWHYLGSINSTLVVTSTKIKIILQMMRLLKFYDYICRIYISNVRCNLNNRNINCYEQV